MAPELEEAGSSPQVARMLQTNDAKTWDSSYDGDAIEWSGDFLGVNQRNRCLDRFGESLAGDNRSS